MTVDLKPLLRVIEERDLMSSWANTLWDENDLEAAEKKKAEAIKKYEELMCNHSGNGTYIHWAITESLQIPRFKKVR